MGAIGSEIISLTSVYSTVYPDADQRKHQSSVSLAFVGNSSETGELWRHCNEKPFIKFPSICLCHTVYPKKYAHGFVVLCFVVVMQSFIMNSYEVFIHIHQGCFAGTGAIVRLPQCQGSKPDGHGKISQCITTTKHSKAKTVCIFLGIYCTCHYILR